MIPIIKLKLMISLKWEFLYRWGGIGVLIHDSRIMYWPYTHDICFDKTKYLVTCNMQQNKYPGQYLTILESNRGGQLMADNIIVYEIIILLFFWGHSTPCSKTIWANSKDTIKPWYHWPFVRGIPSQNPNDAKSVPMPWCQWCQHD